jgi:hypothetical protein
MTRGWRCVTALSRACHRRVARLREPASIAAAGVRMRHRAAFVSDCHLGATHCHAAELATFLEQLQCDRLYLVGDIVDLWWMACRRAQWGAAQNRVVEALHALRRAGTE